MELARQFRAWYLDLFSHGWWSKQNLSQGVLCVYFVSRLCLFHCYYSGDWTEFFWDYNHLERILIESWEMGRYQDILFGNIFVGFPLSFYLIISVLKFHFSGVFALFFCLNLLNTLRFDRQDVLNLLIIRRRERKFKQQTIKYWKQVLFKDNKRLVNSKMPLKLLHVFSVQ